MSTIRIKGSAHQALHRLGLHHDAPNLVEVDGHLLDPEVGKYLVLTTREDPQKLANLLGVEVEVKGWFGQWFPKKPKNSHEAKVTAGRPRKFPPCPICEQPIKAFHSPYYKCACRGYIVRDGVLQPTQPRQVRDKKPTKMREERQPLQWWEVEELAG